MTRTDAPLQRRLDALAATGAALTLVLPDAPPLALGPPPARAVVTVRTLWVDEDLPPLPTVELPVSLGNEL